MYLFPEFVNLGLKEGQDWPSDYHKSFAETVIIGNPNIRDRDVLEALVQTIIKIPQDMIKEITWKSFLELVDKYYEDLNSGKANKS